MNEGNKKEEEEKATPQHCNFDAMRLVIERDNKRRRERYPLLFLEQKRLRHQAARAKLTNKHPSPPLLPSLSPSQLLLKASIFFVIFSYFLLRAFNLNHQMLLKQTHKSSFRESVKALEADVQHANTLAAALPRDFGEECIRMKVSYSPFAPFLLFLIEWMDYSCLDRLPCCLGLLHILVYKEYGDGMTKMSSEERKASTREFYTVIYPLLKQLEDDLLELMDDNYKRTQGFGIFNRKGMEERKKPYKDSERDDECGICMETGSNVVLPNCGHSMCIGCYHDWYVRSQSCPFCRGNLKRVSSGDLWILTRNCDVVDTVTLAKENLRRFYLYIEKLPLVVSDNNLVFYDYMI